MPIHREYSDRRRFAGACAAISVCAAVLAPAAAARAEAAPALHIDVPVTLERGNVVFDIGHTVLNGDTPYLAGDITTLIGDYAAGKTDGRIVLVFHGDAAYITLDDETYDAVRHVKTGNPYAKLLAGWMHSGVEVELCGVTAAANHWTNANLAAGVKVNTDAMARVTQLEQQGYTLIYE